MKRILSLLAVVLLSLGSASSLRAQEQTNTFRVIGLFSPERQDDLRELLQTVSAFQLVSLNFPQAEATLRYELPQLFPNTNLKKPPTADAILKRLDELLRQASQGAFTLRPLCTLPADQLTKLEIKVIMPDCKGCRHGVYSSVAKLEGVERATVDSKTSVLTAWIDGTKTKREALIEALKKARVELPSE